MSDEWKGILAMPLIVAWSLAGPITYIINIIDTWQGRSSILVKLLINLTLDAFLAAIWPITWLLWIVQEMAGGSSPISRVLGF